TISAHSFFMALYYLCALFYDVHQWLTGASLATRPIALEDGVTSASAGPMLRRIDTSTDTERIVLNTRSAVLNTIFCLCYTYVFDQRWIRGISWPPDVAAQAPAPLVQVLDDGVATKEKEYKKSSAAADVVRAAVAQPTNQVLDDGVTTMEKGYMEADKA
ncbi:hypothetical protein B0H13DRAFT_2172150, partial [Mycena leptocephala]